MSRSRSSFVLASLLPVLAGSLQAQLTMGDAGQPLPARAAAFAFFDQPRGRLTLFGGDDATAPLGDCWQLDDGAWVQIPVTPGNNMSHGACCEDPARFGAGLLFGGCPQYFVWSAQTRRWNRETMRFDLLSPSVSPPARSGHAMALDTNRGRAVLYGGATSFWLADTWEWDGTNWQQKSPTVSPHPRSDHAMAFDAARGCVVMYGGHHIFSYAETWTYDGTTWTLMPGGGGPGALHNVMLAYDSNRGVVVKFGGKSDASVTNDEVWEWNGTAWSGPMQPAERPRRRELGAFVYDPQRRVVTLAGGLSGSTRFSDAWHWDGTTWTEARPRDRGTRVVPPARFDAALGYNAVEKKLVLHGGYTGGHGGLETPLTDTWERAGEVWQQRTSAVSPPSNFEAAGATLRGTGAFCYVPGFDALVNPFNSLWVLGSNGWSSVPLNGTPLAPAHQVMGSLLSSQHGWVLVRLVTTGWWAPQTSTLQLIVPNTGVVQTMVPIGVPPPPLVGSSMAQGETASRHPSRVWLFGGVAQVPAPVYSSDLWELSDTGSGGNLAWTRVIPALTSPVPPGRRDAAVAYSEYGLTPGFLVSGGRDQNGVVLNDLWRFTFHTAMWTQLPTTQAPRFRAAAAATSHPSTPNGSALVTFGGSNGSAYDDEVFQETFNAPSGFGPAATWEKPAPRLQPALAYDRANARTLLFGGDEYRNDLWNYDGTTWRPMVAAGPTPGARLGAAACFDEANAAMILFGGRILPAPHLMVVTTVSSQTWALTATGWSLRSSGPGKRERAAMAYIASAQRCLLFGGLDNGWSTYPPTPALYGDTWLYDAAANQWQLAPSGPPPRYYHAMAYDRLRDCVVLFGGESQLNSTPLDDTWEYRIAGGWQQRQPAHRPPGLGGHTMVFDESRGRIVVSGGTHLVPNFSTVNASTKVWEWDGVDWMQRLPDTDPSGRVGAAAVYDAARKRQIAVGGATQIWHSFALIHQGITDDTFELHARVDRAGAGNTANPEGLRFYSQPVVGQTLHLGFANPTGMAFGMIGNGPLTRPVKPQLPPFTCEPSAWFAVGSRQMVTGTVEPNWNWHVPYSPVFLGQTFVAQGIALQATGCWRMTDALSVRF